MNELNFNENPNIIEKLLSNSFNEKNIHSKEDAFLTLINNIEFEDLINLCKMIHQKTKYNELSINEIYQITQMNPRLLDYETKHIVLTSAITCIENGLTLGNKTINNGKINTSSWLSHSLYVAKLCEDLARILNIDENVAYTLGLLHDIGRKYDHSFNHVTKGCELLYNIGWYNEALACLTHSFVNAGRCSNNEVAVPGFYVDDEGNPKWEENTKMDDIANFLNIYKYTDYDKILNIADLMATSSGIVSPYDRIEDIATRRKIDPTNRGYFLSDFTNLLIDFMKKTNYIDKDYPYIRASKNVTLDEIQEKFKIISKYFYNFYLEKMKEFKNNISETKKLELSL